MRVMLVEDDRAVMMVTSSYIESFGFEVIPAYDGETAVELFDPNTIDIVFMDYILPGIDGFETTRQLRETHSDEWFPIIFLTSSKGDEHLANGLAAGGDDYLYKPVSPVVLESKIKAMARIVKMQKDLLMANKKMERLSFLDGLTEVYNRRGFDRSLGNEWRRMRRDENTLSLLMIDVDYFKKFNDLYGHQAGDDCLKAIATTLDKNTFRPADIVARYGGEEFAVLLPGTDANGAKQTADRLVKSIEAENIEHKDSETSPYVTISIGIAESGKRGNNNTKKLIKAADKGLYMAKSQGKNCFAQFIEE
ncbi:MAG: diguanylate cyclase [Gammaproteobacteria bacterium]|nr:diguanylate cyclase [Gammaproteobacteria bacterium]